jgi:uncharacterized protein YbjT (DUF2867 family)
MNSEHKRWLVTGVAGFIGSHIAHYLVNLGHYVVGLDDFSSGHLRNLESIISKQNFSLIEGNVRNKDTCIKACNGIDYVLHHAAIGSVQKSFEAPKFVDDVNNGGFEKLGGSLSKLSPAFKSGIEGAKSLGTQLLTLAANPIGAVILAIVTGVTLLYKAFASTKAGGEQLERVMSGLGAVLDVL